MYLTQIIHIVLKILMQLKFKEEKNNAETKQV